MKTVTVQLLAITLASLSLLTSTPSFAGSSDQAVPVGAQRHSERGSLVHQAPLISFDATEPGEDIIPVSFTAREPYIGKHRIRFLITQPRAAAQELTESVISNSSGLTTRDVRRIRKSLEKAIRRRKPELQHWYRDKKTRGVVAILTYNDQSKMPYATITFSPIT